MGYRRKVVRANLERAFPEMGRNERLRVEKAFYRHLGELLAESIKFFSIDREQAERMLTCRNPELPRHYREKGQHVILAGGHFNSWELYAMGAPFHLEHLAFAIYRPLKDPFFDRVMKRTRERFGLRMIPVRKAARPFRMERPTATIFATDQSPKNTRNVHWMRFLNQDTPVMKGVERFARQYGIPVIFGTIERRSRGHYEVIYELITEEPEKTEDGWITEAHTKALEREILRKPEHWLWTHRRWKRTRSKEGT
jgi:KDO2-lipid IV(A) lauroyltransferase